MERSMPYLGAHIREIRYGRKLSRDVVLLLIGRTSRNRISHENVCFSTSVIIVNIFRKWRTIFVGTMYGFIYVIRNGRAFILWDIRAKMGKTLYSFRERSQWRTSKFSKDLIRPNYTPHCTNTQIISVRKSTHIDEHTRQIVTWTGLAHFRD